MSDVLAIVGAGGHGREALAIARAVVAHSAAWESIRIHDDNPSKLSLERLERVEAALGGNIADLIAARSPHVIAVGCPTTRRSIADRVGGAAPIARLVDPSAWIGDDVELGEGVIVHPGAMCTTNVRIGTHSHLNCRAVVSHDCRIGDFVSISPGVLLNGDVIVEDDVFVGTGSIVLPGRRIGQGAVIGAGAVVVDDVEAGATVVGSPARPRS